MSELLLITGAIAVIVLLLGIIVTVVAWKRRKEGKVQEINYYTFFVMGIAFLSMGIIFMIIINPGFIGFMGLGIIYMIIGLSHRDKWKTNKKIKRKARKSKRR